MVSQGHVGKPYFYMKRLSCYTRSKLQNGGDFVTSDDWFTRWKNDKRHGINFSNVFEEKHWLTQLDIEKEGLDPEHIDETELNFIRLPESFFHR